MKVGFSLKHFVNILLKHYVQSIQKCDKKNLFYSFCIFSGVTRWKVPPRLDRQCDVAAETIRYCDKINLKK